MEKMPQIRHTFYTEIGKRFLDVIISATAIIALSPILLILSIFELYFHGFPIIYSQLRPGKHGKLFKLYKFRSMTNEKDDQGNLLPSEKRLTKFGRFIRRYSLDELPELFCIFLGKMSIIGPRPLLPEYLPLYTKRHLRRHAIRPGLACVPLNPTKTWTWNDQFENDIWYAENCSLLVDIKMIFAVLREAIHGSEYRINDTRPGFNGSNLFQDAKENANGSMNH